MNQPSIELMTGVVASLAAGFSLAYLWIRKQIREEVEPILRRLADSEAKRKATIQHLLDTISHASKKEWDPALESCQKALAELA